MNTYNFHEENVETASFDLVWIAPDGYEYTQLLDSWTIRVYEDDTYVAYADTVVAAALRTVSNTTLSITVAPYTEYNIGIFANFEEVVRDEDPYSGDSSTETYNWSSDVVIMDFSTTGVTEVPVIEHDGDWPDYTTWIVGDLNLKVDLPDDFVEGNYENYYIQYKSIVNGNNWTNIRSLTKAQLLPQYPEPIRIAMNGVITDASHEFRVVLVSAGTVYNSASLTVYEPVINSAPMKAFPYVVAIPTSLGTPSSIYLGNLPDNAVYNPYAPGDLPGDLQEWIYRADALYDSVEVKLYHRSVAAQPYRFYPSVPIDPTIVDNRILQLGPKFNPSADRWWDLSTASTVHCYAPVANFAFSGSNHPFVPINTVLPIAGSWEWPTGLLSYTWAEDISDITPEDHGLIGIWLYGPRDTPITGVHYLDNAATEIVATAHEPYTRYMSGLSTAAIDYKVYVFIKHDNLITDVFKLLEADDTSHTLSVEAADITFNGEQGKLFSATLNASPRINNEDFSVQMDITEQQFSVEDAGGHSFGEFAWPRAALDVSFTDYSGPFYMSNEAVIQVVAPASPYSDAPSQAMITSFELTNPYPQPVLA
jgi:hypothetical protein